ncbi:MAG: M14 family metallopeptidase [Bacteroidota bacterium]|nr:M14 family metallopeptidase [Bacteroidota bacterium]
MKKIIATLLLPLTITCYSQSFITPFEKSKQEASATYFECIQYYKKLAAAHPTLLLKTLGITDAGYPLHLLLYSADKTFNPEQWHQQNKIVLLINNGIHPGEPDGIDASMMLLRDITEGKIKCPKNVVLAVIPIYNIGGSLNRNSFSRVNQNGPLAYGFRGNAQNLDLNRDFTKCDSKEAQIFAALFHWLNPDIFMDNHVSDGADYQHTMTLLTTHHSKLNSVLGEFLHSTFEPALFKEMQEKKWPMCPYVNFEEGNPQKGWDAFYDPPRYSSGYTTLFQTLGFVPETHMLKPFSQRVWSTYALMQTMIDQASFFSTQIIKKRKEALAAIASEKEFPLGWKVDSTRSDQIPFSGYEPGIKKSEVTGMNRLFYDHSKPFTKDVTYYNYLKPLNSVEKPMAYLIPQGWHAIIELLQLNNVKMQQLKHDSTIEVQAYRIESFKTLPRPYEKHYKHSDVRVISQLQKIHFLKGDYIIPTGYCTDRFVVEMLEPTGDDSYFAWNFFDAILQQKEGYSDYRWEDIAAGYLQFHPDLRNELEEKKKADTAFAASAHAQLDFVYKHSPYYEPAHLRYPVYRLNK